MSFNKSFTPQCKHTKCAPPLPLTSVILGESGQNAVSLFSDHCEVDSFALFCFSMSHKQWIQQLHTEVPGTWIQKKYFLLCKLCFSLMFVPVKRKESTVVLPSTLYDISIFTFLKPLEIAIKICLQMIQYLHISILVCLYVCNYILISINVGREREEN